MEVRPRPSPGSAPFAWDDTSTIMESAGRQRYGMDQKASVEGTTRGDLSVQAVLPCASTGNFLEVVGRQGTPKTTGAPDVGRPTMAPKLVLEQRRSRGLTTYNPAAWKEELSRHSLLRKYPNLVDGIIHGFNLGIPTITRTYNPVNHMSIKLYHDAYLDIVNKEFRSGCYLGPYSRREVEGLIGPFQSSPLSLVPKPGKPGKFRAVHNFSYPHESSPTPSINSFIEAENNPCTWGTFETICFLISQLPPGSQASVRDVAEAYRTIPAHHSQWPGLVVRLEGEDEYAINTNNNFSLTSVGGIYGHLADAGADILRANGIGPLSKWVDDHILFRILRIYLKSYNANREKWRCEIEENGGRMHDNSRIWYCGKVMPDGKHKQFDEDCSAVLRDLSEDTACDASDRGYTYNDADVDAISDRLGIKWEPSKTVPFGFSIPYLGFTWDLRDRTVAIPDPKKIKYLAAITEWESKPTHTLLEVQQLYGKLLHASLVASAGKAYLTNLEAMLGIFRDRPFVPHTPPRHTADDLKWWKWLLQSPVIKWPIPKPTVIVDINAYSDASSGVGIAITVGKGWRAWRLVPGWKADGRDIGWAEAIGFEFLVKHVLQNNTAAGTHIKLYGDNMGVVEGWWNGHSRNWQTNLVFWRIHEISHQQDCTIHTRYVPSKQNPADKPSRGIYASTNLLLPHIAIPKEVAPYVVDFDDPVIHTWTNA